MRKDNWKAKEIISLEIYLKLMDRHKEEGYTEDGAMHEAYLLTDMFMEINNKESNDADT